MDVEPASHGFGLFGEEFGYPGGGLCLSVFLGVHREGELLVGRMAQTHADEWTKAWAPNLAYYEGERRERLFEGWRLPASYLRVGEAPQAAARRVWRDQLGFDTELEPGQVRVSSSSKPSRRTPEHEHWDVLFVYDVPGEPIGDPPAHWETLTYEAPDRLAAEDGVMLHGDVLELVSRREA